MDITYLSMMTKLSIDNVKGNIGNLVLTSEEYHLDYTEQNKVQYKPIIHKINAEVYSIKNIPDKVAIAIKFEGNHNYYIYATQYKAETLEEFIKDLNLTESMSLNCIYYDYLDKNTNKIVNMEFYGVDKNIVSQKLFNDTNLKNVFDYYSDVIFKKPSNKFEQKISIAVDIPTLGVKNKTIQLKKEGYLLINILDGPNCFYIGEDKVQDFINYIKDNYKGQKK